MEVQKGYTLYEFDNQKDYAKYMLDCVADGSISRITICGYKNELMIKRYRCYFGDMSLKDFKKCLSGLKPMLILKCNYSNMKK